MGDKEETRDISLIINKEKIRDIALIIETGFELALTDMGIKVLSGGQMVYLSRNAYEAATQIFNSFGRTSEPGSTVVNVYVVAGEVQTSQNEKAENDSSG